MVLISLRSLTLGPLWLFPSVFLYTAKVHWLRAILWFLYLLWCFMHRRRLTITLISSFPLEDPVINFNYLLNKVRYTVGVFYKYQCILDFWLQSLAILCYKCLLVPIGVCRPHLEFSWICHCWGGLLYIFQFVFSHWLFF